MDDLYARLAELLETDTIGPDDELAANPLWDSLTTLALIATLDAKYGVNMSADELRSIRTAGELATVVESRRRA